MSQCIIPMSAPTRIRSAALSLLVALVGSGSGCTRSSAPSEQAETSSKGLPRFEDVTARAGITFRHFDPATPHHLITETMGSGVAWIDYDADGWPDLVCVQDGPLPPSTTANPPTHRLYRNTRDGTFTDVSEAVGLNVAAFGMGVAVGDFDNDGFDDLVITSLGGLTLFHNEPHPAAPGGRHFVDVTNDSGLAGTNPHWGTSCAWGDLDGDGLLDLYVCNYVVIDAAKPVTCRDRDRPIYHSCSPTAYPITTHRLYRNRGGGKFQDVSSTSGIASARPGAGLGVVIGDLDGDGRPDIYVANDMFSAYLFHNQTQPGGPITLVERAGLSGCALGPNGVSMSGMCAEIADVDGSGRPSIFVTNFQDQPNVLFQNLGGLRFREMSGPSGLGAPSRSKLGFGAVFLDADGDGNPDVAVANGHVYRTAQELLNVPYAQEMQLFRGDGKGRFRDVSRSCGREFSSPRVGRGLARGDFDNDGRPDLVVSSVGGPLALFRNTTETANNWIGLELSGDGKTSNRNAIGAVVTVEAGGQTRTHFIVGGGSYLSASERRLTIGLGPDAKQVDRIAVRWPSGRTQEYRGLAAGRYWQLREGESTAR